MTDHMVGFIGGFVRAHPAEASRVLERRPREETVMFVAGLPADLAGVLLGCMEAGTAALALEAMEPPRAAAALSLVPEARAVALARALSTEVRVTVIGLLPPDRKRHVERLLSFREDTVGSLMDPRAPVLLPETPAAEAIAHVRADASRLSRYLYVVDRPGVLIGVVSIKDLLAGADDASVSELMNRNVVFLRTGDSLSSAAVHPAWAAYRMLPVVDEQGLFAGVLHRSPGSAGDDSTRRGSPTDQAAWALGELYGIGLSALMNGAIGGTASEPSRTRSHGSAIDEETSNDVG